MLPAGAGWFGGFDRKWFGLRLVLDRFVDFLVDVFDGLLEEREEVEVGVDCSFFDYFGDYFLLPPLAEGLLVVVQDELYLQELVGFGEPAGVPILLVVLCAVIVLEIILELAVYL